ncbi:MAG: hypothetical protein IIZ10_07420 [Solobacterium sp.]|nr:hypothetical protein [Solobacterium sp.]
MKNVKSGFPGNKTAPSSLDFMRFEEGNLKRIELFPNNPLFSFQDVRAKDVFLPEKRARIRDGIKIGNPTIHWCTCYSAGKGGNVWLKAVF